MTMTNLQPVTIGVANLASVSTGRRKARETYRRALNTDGVDLWLLVECADLHLRADAPHGWTAAQFGSSLSPYPGDDVEAVQGNGLAWQENGPVRLDGFHLRYGSDATSEGGGIRRRFILSAEARVRGPEPGMGWGTRVAVGHAPPPRAPRARAQFMQEFREVPGILGGDLNLRERMVERFIRRRRVIGVGVMYLVIPRSMKVLKVRRIKHGSDHTAVAVTLRPKR